MEKIQIKTESIQLDQFLKWAQVVQSGGEAKALIQSGNVSVNGEQEKRRSHRIFPGDQVDVTDHAKFLVISGNDDVDKKY